ncbi:MAG: hypothetical protein MI919_40085 [Holophagales bacterium]|nr:hypothetical protein [Holophagales bacterium]
MTIDTAQLADFPSVSEDNGPLPAPLPELHPGLDGVYLNASRVSRVDGEAGELTLGGFELEELAPRASFEEVAWMLLAGELPTIAELGRLRAFLARHRTLPPFALSALSEAAERRSAPMAALRLAVASFELGSKAEAEAGAPPVPEIWEGDGAAFYEALSILARVPTAVATYERLAAGLEPGAPSLDPESSLSAAFLEQLHGRGARTGEARALDTYLATVADHGCNASTFTARVVISTGAGLVPSVLGALGALSGPLHGGAPGPALDLVLEIGTPERAEEVIRARLAAGERLMGFGHRVYKVRDPRAAVLAGAVEALFAESESKDGKAELYALFRHVEATATRLLDEHKPGRRLRANVELYTALLLDGLGLRSEAFSCIFAMGRTAGWLAHAREQQLTGRLIRPRLRYEGERGRRYTPPADLG